MEVYDTLAVALPIMGLLAFTCGQIVAVLILRRRFAKENVSHPLQRRLQIGLYIGAAVFASLWGYLFVLCTRAVLQEVIKGNWLPSLVFVIVLAMAVAGLVTVSWFAVRHRTKDLERLSFELQALSGDLPSVSQVPQPDARSSMQERPLTEKARYAVLYLGASNYRATLEILQKADSSSS